MQKLFVTGRLGRDPEIRYTPDQKAVTTFSVASDRKYKEVKETTWFKVTVWGNQAEACNTYLHKGDLVLVEGYIIIDPKTGASKIWSGQDGSPRTTLEINASHVEFLNTKGSAEQSDSAPSDEDNPF